MRCLMTACDSHRLGSDSLQPSDPICDSHMLIRDLWLVLHVTVDDNKVTGFLNDYKREYGGLIL